MESTPPEIWREIFQWFTKHQDYILHVGSTMEPAVVISQTCRQWREIATEICPFLWSSLSVSLPCTKYPEEKQNVTYVVDAVFAQTGEENLQIEFSGVDVGIYCPASLQIFKRILSYAHRWESVVFYLLPNYSHLLEAKQSVLHNLRKAHNKSPSKVSPAMSKYYCLSITSQLSKMKEWNSTIFGSILGSVVTPNLQKIQVEFYNPETDTKSSCMEEVDPDYGARIEETINAIQMLVAIPKPRTSSHLTEIHLSNVGLHAQLTTLLQSTIYLKTLTVELSQWTAVYDRILQQLLSLLNMNGSSLVLPELQSLMLNMFNTKGVVTLNWVDISLPDVLDMRWSKRTDRSLRNVHIKVASSKTSFPNLMQAIAR
ncbi:hypothetical protein EDD85DRAFT_797962 [Armillaria nabsnona]|nr:hypothetical protein EDD85DRAFT_797962 [Armillaria nabsnona]